MQKTGSPLDLAWLLDDLVRRVGEAEHDIGQDDAEHLSAVAAGIQSLARGAGERFGGGSVQQTIIEMKSAFLLVTVAGQGACLAVLATAEADVGLVAYEMALLVGSVGQHLTSPSRSGEHPAGPIAAPGSN